MKGESGSGHQLWWSGVWTDGHPAVRALIGLLDDRPVSKQVCLDLASPPLKWQTQTYLPGAKGFWSQAFAREIYLANDMHEEHRLVIQDETGVLGVVAALWDRRRTGVVVRHSRAQREGHARWAHACVRHVLHQQMATDVRPEGHVVVAPQEGIRFACPAAHRWLDEQRADQLLAGVARVVRTEPPRPTTIAVAGAEVRLKPMNGPQGAVWLGELHPMAQPRTEVRQLLTPAQATVIERALEGSTAVEIARELGKSVETVRSQIKQAYARLGVGSRLELARAVDRATR